MHDLIHLDPFLNLNIMCMCECVHTSPVIYISLSKLFKQISICAQ